jgi:hypothetical protein
MLQMITDALREVWQSFLDGLIVFLPRLIAMLTILIVGLLVAWLLATLTRRLLGVLRFNAFIDRVGGGELFRRAGIPPADLVVSSVVYWLVLVGFILSGLQALGITGMETVVSDFLLYLPRIVVAVVILAVGFMIATFAWRATLLATVNASVLWARPLSEIVRFLILALVVAMALEQLTVAKTVVLTAFAITFGAVMLGLAIAIGIGGAGVVRRVMEERMHASPPPRERDSSGHL